MKVLWDDTIEVDGCMVNLRCNNLIGLDPQDGRPVRLIPPELAYEAAEREQPSFGPIPVRQDPRMPSGAVAVIA